jgi:hypothetical protein
LKIYRIVPDVNRFQGLSVEDDKVWQGTMLTFDCTPKSSTWAAPSVYVLQPKLKKGNFFNLCPGALVLDAHAAEVLRGLLEMSGELLPLRHKDEQLTVLNVVGCFNVLDESKTTWVYGKSTGAKIRIERYAFHASRLTETPLFKIPETCKSDILTVEGLKDSDDEFKGRVERLGLKGLAFEELWTDQA